MNDPIKKFVEQHREAFDHMEPPSAVLEQLQQRLKAAKVIEEKKTVPLFNRTKWIAAASVFLAITAGLFLYNNTTDDGSATVAVQPVSKTSHIDPVNSSKPKEAEKTAKTGLSNSGEVTVDQANGKDHDIIPQQQMLAKQSVPSATKNTKRVQAGIRQIGANWKIDRDTKDLYARLGDSSSSSVRLSAILDIEKTDRINENTLNNLAKTLNHDSNSNVRLAALQVMSQYSGDQYVSSLLVSSFATQKDPLVQLGLIGLLGKIDNVKVEDRLFALADDPNTFEAVKDEAYLALLNQNKL